VATLGVAAHVRDDRVDAHYRAAVHRTHRAHRPRIAPLRSRYIAPAIGVRQAGGRDLDGDADGEEEARAGAPDLEVRIALSEPRRQDIRVSRLFDEEAEQGEDERVV